MNIEIKCNHKVTYRRKYKYDTYEIEIPELSEVINKQVNDWVNQHNAYKANAIANTPGLSSSPYWTRKVTANDWRAMRTIRLKKDGKFAVQFITTMDYMDKLKGANAKKKVKESANGNIC
jgi:hypothetical protein